MFPIVLILASTSNTTSNNGAITSLSAEDLTNDKNECNPKQSKEHIVSGRKKTTNDHKLHLDSKNIESQACSTLENMETEVQSPIKDANMDQEKSKSNITKSSNTSGRMDPPKLSVYKKGGGSTPKNIAPLSSIVQAPSTSSTVGGPSLPSRSSVGHSNPDFSSFKTYR